MVLDASAAVELLLGHRRAAAPLRARVARPGQTVNIPHLFDVEVLAALRRHALRRTVEPVRTSHALAALTDLRAFRYSHVPLRPRIWALRENLSAYDATYVALAEALDAPLVTVDAALARAPGVRADVELYP